VGNTIGQANAVSDKPLDLRYCDFRGADLRTKTLSGGWGLMAGGKVGILISRWVLRCWVGAFGVWIARHLALKIWLCFEMGAES
jgi:hypothetical protein